MQFQTPKYTVAMLAIALSSYCVECPAQAEPVPAVAASSIETQLEEAIRPYAKAEGASFAVTVVKDGKSLARVAHGIADVSKKAPLSPDDVFRIGSVTKQFTAVGVLMLADEGKLDVKDDISKYLPDFPAKGKAITIEHLLTHTSGIPGYTELPGFRSTQTSDLSVSQMIDTFKNESLRFDPGSRWQYSNSGYFLLGAIIEKVSGKSYAEFMAERIFVPLAMRDTAYEGHERSGKKRVAGLTADKTGFTNAGQISMSQPYAAGALVSTVDDLARWDAAISAAKLLKPETWQRVFTEFKLADGKPTGYGYGWMIRRIQGKPAVAHGGGINGFASFAIRIPEEKIFVAILSNNDTSTTHPYLAEKLAAIAMGKPLPNRIAVKVENTVFDQFAGRYQLAPNFVMTVFRDGDRFYTQATGQRALEVFAEAENKYFPTVIDATLEFSKNSDGKVEKLTLVQGGRATQAKRLADQPTVEMSIEAFDKLAGKYQLAPEFVLTISREGERFYAQATGQSKAEIFAESELRFFYRVAEAKIEFMKAADGKIDGLTLTQGKQEMKGPRLP